MNNDKINLLTYTDNFKKHEQVKSELIYGDKKLTENPYITIAIPTYKRPILLKEAIDSALNQIGTDCEYEVIVVDNEVKTNVETETEKLIKSYADKRLLYYKNEKNIGMFSNWNRCIELSRAKWVAFLHDDDLLKADYINKITHLITKKQNIGALIASCKRIRIGIQKEQDMFFIKKNIKQFIRNYTKKKLIRIRTMDCEILNYNIYGAPTCGILFNKEYVIKEGGFNEEYFPSGDWFFMFKFNKSYEVYKTVDILSYYRISDNESLKINTLKGFITDTANFIEYTRSNSLIGLLMYKLFRYEQHVVTMKGIISMDKSSTIKPEEFNYICEYKIRPVRLFIYKKINTLFWFIKKINALIFG